MRSPVHNIFIAGYSLCNYAGCLYSKVSMVHIRETVSQHVCLVRYPSVNQTRSWKNVGIQGPLKTKDPGPGHFINPNYSLCVFPGKVDRVWILVPMSPLFNSKGNLVIPLNSTEVSWIQSVETKTLKSFFQFGTITFIGLAGASYRDKGSSWHKESIKEDLYWKIPSRWIGQ